RLLDQLKFDEWLALYAPECIYWVPSTPEIGDPRREVSISFDDRRRMEDRIYRLRTGYAWSQAPKSRTVRLISNVAVFAAGNGGGGMAVVRDFTQNRSWTQEQFIKAGYAVAWLRYRAEVDYAYDKIGKLVEDRRQRRQLLNRGPLEYEDVISIVEYAKTLPSIVGDRSGYMGRSH